MLIHWRTVNNGHNIMTMKKISREIPAGQFKATCLALLDRVAETGESFVVTKRGRPVARVVPLGKDTARTLAGSVATHGDIIGPVLGDWDAAR